MRRAIGGDQPEQRSLVPIFCDSNQKRSRRFRLTRDWFPDYAHQLNQLDGRKPAFHGPDTWRCSVLVERTKEKDMIAVAAERYGIERKKIQKIIIIKSVDTLRISEI